MGFTRSSGGLVAEWQGSGAQKTGHSGLSDHRPKFFLHGYFLFDQKFSQTPCSPSNSMHLINDLVAMNISILVFLNVCLFFSTNSSQKATLALT